MITVYVTQMRTWYYNSELSLSLQFTNFFLLKICLTMSNSYKGVRLTVSNINTRLQLDKHFSLGTLGEFLAKLQRLVKLDFFKVARVAELTFYVRPLTVSSKVSHRQACLSSGHTACVWSVSISFHGQNFGQGYQQRWIIITL